MLRLTLRDLIYPQARSQSIKSELNTNASDAQLFEQLSREWRGPLLVAFFVVDYLQKAVGFRRSQLCG